MAATKAILNIYFELYFFQIQRPIDSKLGRKYRGDVCVYIYKSWEKEPNI